jgi:hypothetical protein
MDLREKFIIDLFDSMHDMDKGSPRYKEMPPSDRPRALAIGEGMIKRGWYIDTEKGKL